MDVNPFGRGNPRYVNRLYQPRRNDHVVDYDNRYRDDLIRSLGLKIEIPEFTSKVHRDDFIDWLSTVERLFDVRDIPDKLKVKLVAIKLRQPASLWWDHVNKTRRIKGKSKVETWEKMKKLMKAKFCWGHILNGMSDSLFDVYTNVESAKELWDSLESKYMAEDSSSKKFLKDFKHTLKHGKDDLSLVQLGSHLRKTVTRARVDEIAWWIDSGATTHVILVYHHSFQVTLLFDVYSLSYHQGHGYFNYLSFFGLIRDSVGTPVGRVILFGTIPTTIPDITPVISPPTTQTDTTVIPTKIPIIVPIIPPSSDYTPTSPNYSPASDTESDPSEDPSSDHIPSLPATSPFLSSTNVTTDNDTPNTPPSPTHAPGQPIPHGRPYRYHPNGLIHMMTARKRVRPLLVQQLVVRHSVDHSSSDYFSLDDSARDSSSDSSSKAKEALKRCRKYKGFLTKISIGQDKVKAAKPAR
ncbi:putative reverse transcriptase domain-containing protein [Tanacetum coccineum]